ncbi:pantothenate transporter [Penicillium canariense]|uniref:Pantothenate transporter n=1 Tax=Penicillium canariense TaxID=189055 RepID=A0A9W9IJ50_9EURO|nr:pantothenate transporter [Penicillium canariense]KAJ5176755.1 pantothenate transporter [Penicillium canariense]
MCMSVVSSNIGALTKIAVGRVIIFASYGVGQIVAPQYATGFRAFYISVALMSVIVVLVV